MEAHKEHILIIDDDGLSRTLMVTNLEENGFIVYEAEDGSQGLEMMRSNEIDLVLLDLLMPVMDGFEVLQQMKGDKSLTLIPVIIISGEMDQENIVQCINMGAVDYQIKPCDPVLLNTRIKNVLNTTGRMQERRKTDPAMVLIVDDDSFYRLLLTTSLEEKGHIVSEVEDGKQAWEMICAGSYDLVFLDLLMPVAPHSTVV
ncbi:MAG: response regulator [Desulfamplus sp.]|nr:response regulator [Desulfamplus sp.]